MAKLKLGIGMTLFGRLAPPRDSLNRIRRYAFRLGVVTPEVILGIGITFAGQDPIVLKLLNLFGHHPSNPLRRP